MRGNAVKARAQVIGIQGLVGGSGASAVTAGVAAALCELGDRAIAVDLNHDNMLALYFGFDPTANAGLARLNNASKAELLQIIFESGMGYPFIPMGYQVTTQDHGEQAEIIQQTLAKLSNTSDRCLVIDLPKYPSPMTEWAYAFCDVIVNVVQPEPRLIRAMAAYFAEILPSQQRANCKSFVLVNAIAPQLASHQASMDYLIGQLGDHLAPVMVQRDQHLVEALAKQMPLHSYRRNAQATQDFDALALWLKHVLSLQTPTESEG